MKISLSRNIVALPLMAVLLAACSGNDNAVSAAAKLPPECEEFLRTIASCDANGNRASEEDAEKKYAELVHTYQDGAGLKAAECKQAVDVMKDFQKTGC